MFFFAASWGVILWVIMIGEMFPRMSGWNLSGTYIIYAVFALISIGFIARFVRETNGRELESI